MSKLLPSALQRRSQASARRRASADLGRIVRIGLLQRSEMVRGRPAELPSTGRYPCAELLRSSAIPPAGPSSMRNPDTELGL